MAHIAMTASGRLTVPRELRDRLGLVGEVDFEVEVDEVHDAIVLRPAVLLSRADAWAYTPEHRALLARAHDDARAGRVRHLTEDELASFAD